jgi:hypothetical protein
MRHIGGLFNRSDHSPPIQTEALNMDGSTGHKGETMWNPKQPPQLTDPSSKGCEAGVVLPLSSKP